MARLRFQLLFVLLISSPALNAAETIRFGILSIAQPARIYASWQPFADYLATKMERPVEIVIPRGFGKMKEMIERADIDIFYVNSYVFYRLKQAGHVTGLAQMLNIDGKNTSRSDFFVRADSDINTVSQLATRRIAYVSPMGAGGYLAPRAHLVNTLNEKYQAEEVFSKNLSNSLYWVLLGKADAGAMCGVNYRLMRSKIETGELKIISSSEDYPENIIGAHIEVDPAKLARIQEIIIGMVDDSTGRNLLRDMAAMKIQRFVKYDAALEKMTRQLILRGRMP